MGLKGIEQLYQGNTTLWARVQHLVRMGHNWNVIAEDIGLVGANAERELVSWVNDYKSPRIALPTMRNGGFVATTPKPIKRSPEQQAALFLAWKKQRDGAREALAISSLTDTLNQ